MSSELVTLAERFVRLSRELDETRDAMRRLLLNGGEGPKANPTPAPRRGVNATHPNTLRAIEEETRIIEALRATPGLTTRAVAAAMGTPVSSTINRLKRLRSKGQLQGGGNDGWMVSTPG